MLAPLLHRARLAIEVPGWPDAAPSWVEDVDGDLLTVAEPVVDDRPAPPPGSFLAVVWDGPFGAQRLPATLLAAGVTAGRHWRLRAEGPAVPAQRRAHARATTLLPALVTVDGFVLAVHVVDLSEGGAHVVTPAPAPLVAGELVRVALEVDGVELTLPARVARVDELDGRLHAGCRFLEPSDRQAARIRRYVLRRQGLERARLRR